MEMTNILKMIMKSNKIGITFHLSPDGDSLGSSLGLMKGLSKLGKEVYILSKEKMPEDFKFLWNSDVIDKQIHTVKNNTDCIIVLDCGNVERINADLNLEDRKYTLINIDHHLSNELYGDFNFVDIDSSAVGEIVYKILVKLGIDIDKDIAACLYTALITDNGSFRYSNTTFQSHKIAGELINTGIDFSQIHRNIFENKEYVRMKLYGKAIDKMKLVYDNVCIVKITREMLYELGLEEISNTSDIISLAMQIGVVEVAVLLKEADQGIKVSLRSKSKVDVRKVAENFGGGGHVRAAGLYIKDKNIEEVEKMIIDCIEKELI